MEIDGSSIGKRVGGALYVHQSAMDCLLLAQSRPIAAAAEHVPKGNWNVAKIDLADYRAVSLLNYEDFAEHALNRPAFTGGQNSRRIARYGTESKKDLEAVFT